MPNYWEIRQAVTAVNDAYDVLEDSRSLDSSLHREWNRRGVRL